jgi:shikimate 5-dehydrogenase
MPHRVAELLRKAQQVRRLARLIVSHDFKQAAEQLAAEYEQAAQKIGQVIPADPPPPETDNDHKVTD